MSRDFAPRMVAAFVGLGAVGLATTFMWPSTASVQTGYRGIGIEQVYNRLELEATAASNRVPEAIPPVDPAGQPASAVYQNVQALADVDANEFIRIMTAMTEWVSPEQGCAYCHNVENMADGSLYTYKVARRMLQMTRHANANWKSHVGETGVTCYTCHRGQPVPNNIWFFENRRGTEGLAGNPAGQNTPAPATGVSSLPSDPFSPFFLQDDNIRLASATDLPSGNRTSIKQTEWTYGLMIHFSNALGVNCTYCHNSRAFFDWTQSSPQRVTSWHAIRMLRDLNVNYLEPLRPDYPPVRLGPLGDAPKANCATCHQGAYKPLLGVSMLKDYPVLSTAPPPTAAEAPAGATPPAPAPASAPAPRSP
jgi:photosynthetic reaction center cytochrome c subunit